MKHVIVSVTLALTQNRAMLHSMVAQINSPVAVYKVHTAGSVWTGLYSNWKERKDLNLHQYLSNQMENKTENTHHSHPVDGDRCCGPR